MAHVRDQWTKPGEGNKRIRTSRWGKGKRWLAVWNENGREVTKAFDTLDAAKLYASRAEVGQAEGNWITKDRLDVTLGDMWDVWIASKAGRAQPTIAGYKAAWQHIQPRWHNAPCWKINRAAFNTWIPTVQRLDGQGQLSSASLRKIGIVFNALLEQAVELDIITKNPMRSGDIPRQYKAERRYLTVKEIDKLIHSAPTEQAALMIAVLVQTGLRPGEAKGLKARDLDVLRKRLMIRRDVDALGNPDETKTRMHREVPVGGDLLLDLEDTADNREPDDWLLQDENGHVWTTTKWRRVWKTTCTTAGISGITTYELRHTAASLAIAAGADVKTVQRMLGHASAAMTLDTYAHLWETGIDTVPDAINAHMEAERHREAAKAARRAERTAQRQGLHAVGD
ncbi:site-specific recombinase XerD [Corynebacterium mustelae]|uniref:Site-specific recombinase XerD n=1 Tax=Corynebacterium mustelae TaxID=571915 RepID=A0A0G3H0C6_9CORY|nr:site-specific integrase [Corynebacterium mustelae]AKK04557.1 site-specific recombinase XerD [Corynebacterium mustelae]